MSDGEETGGPDPTAVVQLAADAGVHVSAIGVGTADGTTITVDGYQVATALQEQGLRDLVAVTGGTYAPADAATGVESMTDALERQRHLGRRGDRDHGRLRPRRRRPADRRRRADAALVRAGRLMSFAWPWALLALVAGPALLAVLWLRRRRRRRMAVRVSNVAVVRAAVPPRGHWKRRVPLALLVAAIVAPRVRRRAPDRPRRRWPAAQRRCCWRSTSPARCARPTSQPNRLVVAQDAARTFIRNEDDGTRIGIVAFAGFAGLVVPPTTDTDRLIDAIDKLTTSRGTAIGMAILASIDAIAEYNSAVAPTGVDLASAPADEHAGCASTCGPAPAGNFQPDTIVVLTDGANTEGVEPLVAAEQAAARQVRVYAIGFGTTEPSQPVCNIDQLGGDLADTGGFDPGPPGGGGPGGPGGRRFLEIDEETLQGVADLTGGQYFRAEDADQLERRVPAAAERGRGAGGRRGAQRLVRARRRAAGGERDRPLAVVEPLPLRALCRRHKSPGTSAERHRPLAVTHRSRRPRLRGRSAAAGTGRWRRPTCCPSGPASWLSRRSHS